jgi:GNAT superfamily N-acetyltransferase
VVAADADELARVHVETWRAAYAHALPAEALAALSVEERAALWREILARRDPRARNLVADRGGRLLGFASTGRSRDPDAGDETGELYGIYVRPEAWGHGVGRRLLTDAAETMRTAGFREATLWVLDDNPRARRFYEAAGWQVDGAEKEDIVLGDVRITEVRYRTTL